MLHHCFTQPTKWTKKQMDWLTCGPVGRSLRRRWIYIQRPAFFFNLSSSCSSRPKQRRSCRVLLPLVAGCDVAEASPPPTTPTASPGYPSTHPHPLLFCGDGSLTPQPNQ